MGYFRKAEIKPKSELNTSAPVKKKKTSPEVKSNWEYYEQQIFKRNNYLPSAPARVVRDQRAINAVVFQQSHFCIPGIFLILLSAA